MTEATDSNDNFMWYLEQYEITDTNDLLDLWYGKLKRVQKKVAFLKGKIASGTGEIDLVADLIVLELEEIRVKSIIQGLPKQ